ncbi:MAG: FtsW/RodA/SpoVE family cell cycle protein, partial [bacterium]|nr:FtsW/RodA/SpoVE family cell cycle protein [bacterium]
QSTSKNYLPERIGDSIFAIIAEEFGLIGSLVVIGLFFTLVAKMFILARRSTDQFGKLLLVGFATIIGFQTFVHIGANTGIIPLTGVPLPFISYGGTALAVFMTMIGASLNISKHIKK